MRIRHLAITGLGLGLLLAFPQLASASAQGVAACTTISKPGAYVLTRSLIVSEPMCIVIAADDVKFDLDGQTMTGRDGTNAGIQQAITDNGVAHVDVEITNGAITGFRRAIELPQCSKCKISSMRIDTNGDGINVGMDAHVFNNIVTNSDDDGIQTSREALVHDNLSNDNGSEGIEVTKNSIVKNNVTQGNSGNGLDLQCPVLVVQNISQQNGTNQVDNGALPACMYIDNLF